MDTQKRKRRQDVYFILNHPIQYAYLCGLLVGFGLAPAKGADKYAILELDDGSGCTIEVKIPRQSGEVNGAYGDTPETLISNVKVGVSMSIASLYLDKRPVPVGSVVRVKGTITKFRERQIELKRLFLVESTDEEVRFWARLAKHRRDVLSKPWVFTPAQRATADAKAAAAEKRARDKVRHECRADAKLLAREASDRAKQDVLDKQQTAILNAGALAGSEIIRAPWEQLVKKP
ncbi:hypothetical protein B0A48_10585 [Cryoendolithus antarcticus]|uniref:CST complex subunit Stn1 N-terminal domain-containing protein n=1 Tax=Cryoendolithus antarcticus TaxID=1507870 RepID=A0A1V8SXQ5_9PEZI|nr:hypothetical protein B0A48_10585 [Cryoendolithus antarcticus]